MLASEVAQKAADLVREDVEQRRPWPHRMAAFFRPGRGLSVVAEESSEGSKSDRNAKRGIIRKLRPDMIRRMDDAPKLVNPSGWVTEGKAPSLRKAPAMRSSRADEGNVDPNDPHESPSLTESLKSSPGVATPSSGG